MALYKRGRIWHMSFTFNGVRIRESTETTDKELAKKILHEAATQLIEGKWFPTLPGNSKTFFEMAEK